MTQPSPRTFAEVATHLPACLTDIVRGYFQSSARTPYQIAAAGEYEACMLEMGVTQCFGGACYGNHPAIVKLTSTRGANWNWGLAEACRGGHLAIIEFVIARGANDWNWGLAEACQGGHLTIVELMIKRGADHRNAGLSAACRYGHQQIVELMIGRGATSCRACDMSMGEHIINKP